MTVLLMLRKWLSQFSLMHEILSKEMLDFRDSPLQKLQPRSQGSLLPVLTEREKTWEGGCRNTRENGHKLWVQ